MICFNVMTSPQNKWFKKITHKFGSELKSRIFASLAPFLNHVVAKFFGFVGNRSATVFKFEDVDWRYGNNQSRGLSLSALTTKNENKIK